MTTSAVSTRRADGEDGDDEDTEEPCSTDAALLGAPDVLSVTALVLL
jgi:hypothetical protein